MKKKEILGQAGNRKTMSLSIFFNSICNHNYLYKLSPNFTSSKKII